jgi:hypothetical protein
MTLHIFKVVIIVLLKMHLFLLNPCILNIPNTLQGHQGLVLASLSTREGILWAPRVCVGILIY